MLKSFFTGALVGYFFGCSKQGVQLRESMDRMVTSLLSNSDDDQESTSKEGQDDFGEQAAEEFRNRFGGKRDKSTRAAKEQKRAESAAESGKGGKDGRGGRDGNDSQSAESNSSNGEGGVSMEKAMALASALNAKPTAPETDELEPGSHLES